MSELEARQKRWPFWRPTEERISRLTRILIRNIHSSVQVHSANYRLGSAALHKKSGKKSRNKSGKTTGKKSGKRVEKKVGKKTERVQNFRRDCKLEV